MKRIALFGFAVLSFVVTGDVLANAICWFAAAPTNMDFGTYSGSALTSTSSFSIACDEDTSGMYLRLSRGSSATYTPRTVVHTVLPATTMNYNLYQDAANTIIWGDGTGGTQDIKTGSYDSSDPPLAFTIFGTLPAAGSAPGGGYIDTIQVTLDWGSGVIQRTFIVTVNVAEACTVSTAALSFGSYDPVTANAVAPKDSTGVVNVFCSSGTSATVSLGLGSWASGSTRRLRGSIVDFLTYEVYRDAARTVIWNAVNTNSGTSTSSLTPINGGFTAYGRIFAAQNVNVGSYDDTILVTVDY